MKSDNKKNNEAIDELVKKSQQGDKQAFSHLYDLLINSIYRYVYFKATGPDVEDLVEVIFIKIWQNLDKYEKTEYQFTTWAFKIAHNSVIDHYRKHRPLYPLDETIIIADDNKETNPKLQTENSLNNSIVKKALNELKDPYKQILVLKFIEDLSNEEIAKITGRSEVSIRVTKYRGLKKLREILIKHGIS